MQQILVCIGAALFLHQFSTHSFLEKITTKRGLSLSLNQLPYRNKMAENRKSRAGARRRCEVEDGCDEMVSDTTYYKHKALGCKRRRCDSNDQEGATYRYVQAQLFS